MTYKLLLALIKAGRTEGLLDKIDIFYAVGRITDEQYMDLLKKLEVIEAEI